MRGSRRLRQRPKEVAVPSFGHHVVTTSFGLTPLHPARTSAWTERSRWDRQDEVGWGVSAFGYESEGRVFESPWAHSRSSS